MRKDFEMTEEQLNAILDACKPVPAMCITGGQLMGGSVQENANAAWRNLGEELGFDYMTVRPNGKGDRFFTAETNQKHSMEGKSE